MENELKLRLGAFSVVDFATDCLRWRMECWKCEFGDKEVHPFTAVLHWHFPEMQIIVASCVVFRTWSHERWKVLKCIRIIGTLTCRKRMAGMCEKRRILFFAKMSLTALEYYLFLWYAKLLAMSHINLFVSMICLSFIKDRRKSHSSSCVSQDLLPVLLQMK